MTTPIRRHALIVMGTVLTLMGCASTRINNSWKDPTFVTGSMHKALVMSVVPQSTGQRVMEDAFVKHLSEHGVQAVPSYSLSPMEAKLNEDGWKRLIAENNVDTVLVARLVDVKTVEREVPPTSTVVNSNIPAYPTNAHGYPVSQGTGFIAPAYGNAGNWYGYYQNSYQVVMTPGYTVKDTIAVAETKLYDIRSGKMVWTGSTQTQIFPDQDTGALVRQFAKIITTAIYK